MNKEELLPCPFCGETPVVDRNENHSEYGGPDSWLVCCGTAYCYGNAFTLDNSFHSKARACEAWNTRYAVAPTPDVGGDGELLDWVFDRACIVFYPDGKHKHIIRDRKALRAARSKSSNADIQGGKET